MGCKFKKNDYLMDKVTKDMIFVVVVRPKCALIRHEKDDMVEEVAHHFLNRGYSKVDPAVAEVLYADKVKDEEE